MRVCHAYGLVLSVIVLLGSCTDTASVLECESNSDCVARATCCCGWVVGNRDLPEQCDGRWCEAVCSNGSPEVGCVQGRCVQTAPGVRYESGQGPSALQ